MTGATIELSFSSERAERRFLASDLPEAWDRFESSDYWDHGWFWPYSQVSEYEVGVDGGLVRLVFEGDPEAFLDAETDWLESIDGLQDWECRRYDDAGFESLRAQQIDAKGERGGDWEYRYKPLTAALALAYRSEFDDRLPPDPAVTDANPIGIGFFGLVHSLFVQAGYDWYEENDTYCRGLENRLKSIAAYRGADAAREEYERIRKRWDAFEADLEAWLETAETGTEIV